MPTPTPVSYLITLQEVPFLGTPISHLFSWWRYNFTPMPLVLLDPVLKKFKTQAFSRKIYNADTTFNKVTLTQSIFRRVTLIFTASQRLFGRANLKNKGYPTIFLCFNSSLLVFPANF